MTTNKIKQITEQPWKKLLLATLIAGSLTVLSLPVRALDSNFIATSGTNQNLTILNGGSNVTLSVIANAQGGNTANITSTVPNAVLGFVNFGFSTEPIRGGGTVDVVNETIPTGSAILNTVSGGASTIAGDITSNGKVFLLNPAGITVSGGSVINTAGFYASTIPENISYFEANGTLQAFSSNPSAGTTTGTISATFTGVGSTGNVFLAGQTVTVTGGTVNGNLLVVATPNNATITSGAQTTVSLGATTALQVNGTLSAQSGGGNLAVGGGASAVTVTGATTLDTATLAPSGLYAANGTITQGVSGDLSTSGLTVNASGTVTLNGDALANNSKSVSIIAGTINPGASSITGDTDAALTLGTSTVSGSLALATTGGTITLGNLTINGNVTNALNVSVLGAGTNGIGLTSGTGITINTVSGTPQVTLSTSLGGGTGNIVANFNGAVALAALNLATTANLTLSATGNIALPAAAVTANAISLTSGASITGVTTITGTTSVTEVAPAGIAVAGITSPTVTLNASAGNITQTGIIENAGATNTTTLTVNSGGSITLGLGNLVSTIVATGPGSLSFTAADAGGLTIGNGTNIGGAAAFTNPNGITFGALATDTLAFGSSLTATSSSAAITTTAYNFTVGGNVNLSTTGFNIQLGNPLALGIATNYSFGQISASAGAGTISLNENSTLNLGTINTTNSTTSAFSATSSNGNIISSGTVTVSGATAVSTLAAGTALTVPGTITIGSTLAPAAIGGGAGTGIDFADASSVTLVNSVPTFIEGALIATASNTIGTANFTVTGGQSLQIGAGPLATATVVPIGNLNITSSGAVTAWLKNGTTISNTAISGSGNVLFETDQGAITLGAGINISTTGTTTFTATSNKANIVDTANSPVNIFGTVIFNSDAGINITNNTANSLGPISLIQTNTGTGSASSSAGNSAVSYTEGGTVNLQAMTILGSGNVTIKSVSGNVVDTAAAATFSSIADNNTGSAVVSFSGNQVLLNADAGLTGQPVSILSTIAVTANTDSYIADSPANTSTSAGATLTKVVLGNIVVTNGAFTLDARVLNTNGNGAANTQITQNTTATTIFIYGNSVFDANGTGVISLTNSGNNFGGITALATTGALGAIPTTSALAGTGAVSITENGTSNYTSVVTGGPLTAISSTGSIIEVASGTGTGILVGGQNIGPSAFTISGTGQSIALTNPLNNFGGSTASSKGIKVVGGTGDNATISDSNTTATLLADGTNVSGNLTVTNTSGTGFIDDAGATNGTVTVGGVLSLSALGTGGVAFTGSTNNIAQLTLKAGSGSSTFTDGANLILAGSSVVTGPLTITANGISATGSAPSTFGGTVNLTAQIGSILLSDTGLFFQKQVTLSAATGANLSALSLAINFGSIAPIAGSTPNYVPPGP